MNSLKINIKRIVLGLLALVTFLTIFAGIALADESKNFPNKEVAEVPEGTFQIQIGDNGKHYSTMNVGLASSTSLCSDIDLIFILDRSGSMYTNDAVLPNGTTVNRLEAVKFAAKNFIDLLPTGTSSRVGIVSYTSYGYGKIELKLTSDFTAAKNVIDSLTTDSATSIGEGIEKGIEELQGNGNTNKRIFILLTDGLANEYPPGWSQPSHWTSPAGSWATAELYALYEAHVALTFDPTNPTKTYTIGVGYNNSINENLLKVLASSSGGKYFFAGTTSIQGMFNEIAANICAGDIEVLILANFQRMKDIGYDTASVDNLKAKLQDLASNNPNGRGILVNLDTIATIKTAYTNWNAHESDITITNNLVQAIDGYIEEKKKNSYPKTKYVILVGSHEVLPMKPRPDDYNFKPWWCFWCQKYNEKRWSETNLPQKSGYLYDIYHAGTEGYYLTDTIYADLSYKDTSADHELTPELAVGRLVETPDQMINVIDAYMSNNGKIPKNHYVSIASNDYVEGGTQAKDDMVGSGASTDSTLVQCNYASSGVPPLLNNKHDIVYFAGHGNYNEISTGSGSFIAGNGTTNGDTSELNPIEGATIITSGCHNGVNLGNKKYHAPNAGTTYSEFPEEFSQKGVVAYLGATGYTVITGSGCSDDVEQNAYNEKLATDVIANLVRGDDIGIAFTKSANSYYSGVTKPAPDWAKRVLAIPTLYGIPTYKPEISVPGAGISQSSDSSAPIAGYNVQKMEVGPSQPNSEQVIITVTNYSVDFTSGLVIIPGATQDVFFNEPIVPVLFVEKTLPYGTSISVKWNMPASANTIVTNDIPIAGIANSEVAIEGNFSYDGFYPVNPFANYSILTLGGGGSKIGIAVNPVQYNSKTNQTKIWTKMVFDIEYDIPDTGVSVVDLSTNKNWYYPEENMIFNISILNDGSTKSVDLEMIMRDSDTNEEITTKNIGSMGLAGGAASSGTFSINLGNIPRLRGRTIQNELVVLDPNNDNILGSATVTVSFRQDANGEEERITTNSSDQNNPSISGNSIVWKDKRNGNWDIYIYDLSTSSEKQITTNTANQLYPVISGNRIVWEDKRNGNSDIYMYDLSTSIEKQITTNSAHQWYPDISGNRIVWQDKRNGNWDIYMYDLSTSIEKQITTDSKYQTSPSISENRIVWQDYRNGNWDIYMYDLSTNTEKQITTNPANQASPSISGNYIVWKDNRNGNSGIYMYDLSTSTEKQITTDSANKRNPAIYGNNIVWQDHRNGGWDIYMYDLSANTEKRLTTNSAIQSNPSISGNNIVWQDYRNGNWDIYMTDLSR